MVAIKDMEMPKSCWNCNFCCNKDGYYCAISNELLADEAADIPSENIPTDCPLVEIVTCDDCKFCKKDIVKGNKFLWFEMDDFATSEDCYCDSAERGE